jgi:pimeloyl-ACP methyl ester carboxylesterase
VGHSYGGAVITEAGNDPKVVGLVYVTAFAPDKGESVSMLIKDPPPGAPVPPILPPQDGHLFLDKAKFPASFAADVDAKTAAFMADAVASLIEKAALDVSSGRTQSKTAAR